MGTHVVVLNAGKMNFDKALDFTKIAETVTVYEDSTPEEILPRIKDADAVVTKELVLSEELVRAFPPGVKLIVEAGTGYNNIPLQAVREKGITVCNVPAYSTQRVAQTAVMLMLNLASTMQSQIGMLRAGDRSNFTKHLMVPHAELNGKTLGVFGTGNIGSAVIRIAQAMEMQTIACAHVKRADRDGIRFVDKETLLKESDVVSLHCPLNEDTKHMIDETALSLMKPTAFLINTARGALIDEAALIRALRENRIAGAGLDVQETEPPKEDSPLYTMENVILTPHMGWKGKETRERLVRIVAEDVQGFFAGAPVNVVS